MWDLCECLLRALNHKQILAQNENVLSICTETQCFETLDDAGMPPPLHAGGDAVSTESVAVATLLLLALGYVSLHWTPLSSKYTA